MSQYRYARIEELVEDAAKTLGRELFHIIEVGVWNGGRAIKMAEAAFRGGATRVHYIGYDLFDQATPEINLRELNAKPNQTLDKVTSRLTFFQGKNPGFTFGLVPGNTNETLKGLALLADFVYIDGGHSVETIANDYAAFKDCPLVVFDDYYLGLDEETLDKVGANRIVDGLLPEIIDTGDELKMGDVRGTVALAVVRPVPKLSEEVKNMSDAEIEAAALNDPDAQPLSEEELANLQPAKPRRPPRKRRMTAAERRKNMEPPFRDE
jgi:hypothetical protein